ncbi:MAG TPA: family 1 glycosylhydrolase [Candidatus Hydrogenedentes bacterium]|nr:family 1 glycosylhydrolase [Candidatus Hydrogenedentota bacterium]HPG66392.1 family 1 glycosylhydrolase [Candidatus Hydrogenedentota bacterium]
MNAFPQPFLWGATFGGHSVEGGNYASDWWRWEQRPGRIRDGSNSQVAAGHLDRFEGDFELARRFGLNAALVSLEWARIEPEPGRLDTAVLDHYATVLAAMRTRGIEPICALVHVTTPDWFAQRGGWAAADAAARFQVHAERMAQTFATECRWWITLYEPMNTVYQGYIEGRWPPGRRNVLAAALRVRTHLVEAHKRAFTALHAARTDVRVGVALRACKAVPADPERSWDFHAARFLHAWPHAFLRTKAASAGACLFREPHGHTDLDLDFLGVSFYGVERARFNAFRPGSAFTGRADEDHTADAEAFGHAVLEMARYGVPLIVTGNGIATDDDTVRCRYLLDHLAELARVIQGGADVRGYVYRAFLDGFEWTQGYSARFGLVHVDRRTLARTPNPSAYLYKGICETGTFRPGMAQRFCPEWRGPSGECKS